MSVFRSPSSLEITGNEGPDFINLKPPTLLAGIRAMVRMPGSIFSYASIAQFVESPLIPAVTELYDSNIFTYSTSANADSNLSLWAPPASIDIKVSALDPENLKIARSLGAREFDLHCNEPKLRFELSINGSSSYREVAQHFLALARQFNVQELLGARFTLKQLEAAYHFREISDPTRYVAEGYGQEIFFSSLSGFWYMQQEHLEKDEKILNARDAAHPKLF
jgi:hypothetical protein